MIEKVKVLIVDDSIVFRSLIRTTLDGLKDIEVVGVASNGRIALEKLRVMPIDLVILDLEMPEMDGLSVLRELKKFSKMPKVIIFSSLSLNGASITLEGLKLGASDFVTKPDALTAGEEPCEKIKGLLLPKIVGLFNKGATLQKTPRKLSGSSNKVFSSSLFDLYRPKIVTIGSSTGGPSALEIIFLNIRGPLSCPIVIAQHMPPVFTASLAERIQKITGIPTREAKDGEELKNQIYIAPGDFHLRLKSSQSKVYMHLTQDDLINFVRPAVDPLFESAAEIYKEGCLGIILTGMGQDGKVGTAHIKNNDGTVIIQDELSCVVFGMPGAVKSQGTYDLIKNPVEISDILKSKVINHF